jgi:HSP20 family protein
MLMRFDPFRELDRLSDQVLGQGRTPVMPMDAYRKGDEFVIHFDLPGVDPGSIDLTTEKNVVTVRAERRWQREEGTEFVVAERPQGEFSRQLFLGDGLDPSGIIAAYDNGVLSLRVPVAEQAKPRKVEVTAGSDSGPKRLEAVDTEAARQAS